MHWAAPGVGTHYGAEKAAFEVKALHIGLQRELNWLSGQVADDHNRWGYRGNGLGFSHPYQDVLVIAV